MGKNTDKLYVTHSEHAAGPGGAKRYTGNEFKRLPFSCCALSLQPFEHPVCTNEGMVFDLMNIVPWLKKHGNNPVTGEKLEAKDLTKLHFHKNASDAYHCPITFKVFNENTHIVAIKPSGQVYSYEAVERLNIKTKNWTDLMTDVPFKRKDVITLQDPHNITMRNITDFYYVKKDMKVENEGAGKKEEDKINALGATEKLLKTLAKKTEDKAAAKSSPTPTTSLTPSFVSRDKQQYNAAHYSNGAASSSFTSTAVPVQTQNPAALIDEEEYMFERVKGKGYAQLKTNLGDVNLELLCGDAPRACYNFIKLAKKGYYENTLFHRSIKNFMVQGGDPTGTGRGGESIWGKPFPDEFKSNLTHSGRGVLSMANKGKNTNTSQFFITYRSCPHLNNKHTVFGKVVGGLDVLTKIEQVPTDEADKPEKEIKILAIQILIDPFDDFQKSLESKKAPKGKNPSTSTISTPPDSTSGVGKYLATPAPSKTKRQADDGLGIDWGGAEEVVGGPPAKKKVKGGFGDFSGW
ncbi:cyclophilin-like domain-containing protein [Fimicolochytrium jonesii]|uniref:cyclophilin-like domain-containing protein n=1 Tax=Fimicolochytrium jonesii TaxID=1396493 RepID=UPI0022FF2281|nr:cyclophilin-like domain-containing protein [Fimicolochytrium jonesii]KAI8824424.1 cyclophilin-like domain-containing protein [Fimicolochytrium jonesii]